MQTDLQRLAYDEGYNEGLLKAREELIGYKKYCEKYEKAKEELVAQMQMRAKMDKQA